MIGRVACVVGLSGGLALFLASPWAPDWGLPVGYYGQLNRVKRVIERQPALTVVDVRLHRDVSLEDFWIDLRCDNGRRFTLGIVDGGAVRDPDDVADGVVVYDSFNTGRYIPASDTGFWSQLGATPPRTLREFLPQAPRFFELLDRSDRPIEPIDWELSRRCLRLHHGSRESVAIAF